jgi:hypothetical protein
MTGLGYRQLVGVGEAVVDVKPHLGARVRLLATSATNKNDPNDVRSVAVAALRSMTLRTVRAEDHTAIMKLWAKRHHHLVRTRTQAACQLHAMLCELVPLNSWMASSLKGRWRFARCAPAGEHSTPRWQISRAQGQPVGRICLPFGQLGLPERAATWHMVLAGD